MKRKYSWRFKLADFIMGGNLSAYLIFGCLLNIAGIEDMDAETEKEKRMQHLTTRVRSYIEDIMYK